MTRRGTQVNKLMSTQTDRQWDVHLREVQLYYYSKVYQCFFKILTSFGKRKNTKRSNIKAINSYIKMYTKFHCSTKNAFTPCSYYCAPLWHVLYLSFTS